MTDADYRIGMWAARVMVFLAVVYIVTGAVGLRWVPSPAPAPGLVQVDPFLAILEIIMVILAPVEVVLFAAIHTYACREEDLPAGARAAGHEGPRDGARGSQGPLLHSRGTDDSVAGARVIGKEEPLSGARGSEGRSARDGSSIYGRATCALAALVFVSILAGLTCSVHWILLTLGRQTDYAAVPGAFYPWPTVLFAIDLLAWDVFQGLALLFAAPVFRGGGVSKAIRISMIISGGLCIVGVAGPASGDLRFQVPAIFGYAGGLTVVCALLAVFFARATRAATLRAIQD